MKKYAKQDFPVLKMRKLIEPGPVVLVSSFYKGKKNIMTLGWHMVMGYDLIGCYISEENFSFKQILKSKECVINVPEISLLDTTIKIGNESGKEVDKFSKYHLTSDEAKVVKAPLIKECYANIECKLIETKLIKTNNLFVFQVMKVHLASYPKYPKTFHYLGNGQFRLLTSHRNKKSLFKEKYLE